MYYYIIPCKHISEGLPYKCRLNIDGVLSIFEKEYIIITTDDPYIMNKYKDYHIHYNLPQESPKKFLLDVVRDCGIQADDIIVTLYPTYPNRCRKDMLDIIREFENNDVTSLLCCTDIETHPYLCLYKTKDGYKQVIKHDECRRQDYPKCVKVSHFFSIIKYSELKKVNRNLYNENTLFHYIPLHKHVDIDTQKDWDEWIKIYNEQ